MQKESLSGIILAFYKQRIGRHDFKMLYYLSNVYRNCQPIQGFTNSVLILKVTSEHGWLYVLDRAYPIS